MDQKMPPSGNPPRAVLAKTSAGDDEVDMRVVTSVPFPGYAARRKNRLPCSPQSGCPEATTSVFYLPRHSAAATGRSTLTITCRQGPLLGTYKRVSDKNRPRFSASSLSDFADRLLAGVALRSTQGCV